MTPSSDPEFKQFDNALTENEIESKRYEDVKNDPDYAKLLEHYQKGEKDLSLMVLNTLEKRYPDHPELRKLKADLQLKSSVKDLSVKIEKGERKENRKAILNLAIFAVVGIIVVMAALYLTTRFLLPKTIEEVVDRNTAQLTSLQGQAQGLLNQGRPGPAAEIIETMREIDPDWAALPELTKWAETLLDLEARYDQALALAAEEEETQALAMFQSIKGEQPGLWDVRQQIDALDKKLQVNALLEEGADAFASGKWGAVISAFEGAQGLNPDLSSPQIELQLRQAYQNEITRILEDDRSDIEQIEQAEAYNRKALVLLPQGSESAGERARLADLNDALQEKKYTRLAQDIFSDPFQTPNTIASGITYFERARGINPRNAALGPAIANAEIYRVGFGAFVKMDWELTIETLNGLLDSESGYLKANARVLLYEAFYGLAEDQLEEGLVEEALATLDEAEELAFGFPNHPLKLFQARIKIGDIHLAAGENAQAYAAYQAAMESINITARLADDPEVQRDYVEAVSFAENGLFENAAENYQSVFDALDGLYTLQDVTVRTGVCLAFIAHNNHSTIQVVQQANSLPDDVVLSYGGTLLVPGLEN
jgi:tetratricopeptide (TPR) repeat protein